MCSTQTLTLGGILAFMLNYLLHFMLALSYFVVLLMILNPIIYPNPLSTEHVPLHVFLKWIFH